MASGLWSQYPAYGLDDLPGNCIHSRRLDLPSMPVEGDISRYRIVPSISVLHPRIGCANRLLFNVVDQLRKCCLLNCPRWMCYGMKGAFAACRSSGCTSRLTSLALDHRQIQIGALNGEPGAVLVCRLSRCFKPGVWRRWDIDPDADTGLTHLNSLQSRL